MTGSRRCEKWTCPCRVSALSFTFTGKLDYKLPSLADVMDSLEKRVRMFFSQCRRNEIQPGQADGEFGTLRRDYYKVLEDADEKVHLASQMYDLVERYLRRLDSELYKFKCELEADHNGITEILEKRSLELDGNSNSNSLMNNSATLMNISAALTTNNSQKENRYFGSISRESNSISASNNLSSSSMRESSSNSHRYNRHKAEKRRDSNNGPASIGAPPEKRQMLSSSSAQLAALNHNSISTGGSIPASAVVLTGAGQLQSSANLTTISPMISARAGGQTVNIHYNPTAHHHGTAGASQSTTAAGLSQNLTLQAGTLTHGTSNAVIVTTTLGTGPNAVPLGATYTAECEVMRAASQAIAMTHQMQQGRRTASLKASVEAATSGGAAGGSGQDYLGRELVGATHNAIQAVERESFNSNQRRHKK